MAATLAAFFAVFVLLPALALAMAHDPTDPRNRAPSRRRPRRR